MKKLLYIIICMFIALPVFAGVRSFMEKCLDSWIGYSIDSVIDAWGYPASEKEIAGKHLFIWENTKAVYVPQISDSSVIFNNKNSADVNTYSYGGYNITYSCARILEVDKGNKVIKGQWQGNNCPGTYFRGKSWVNPKNDEWARKKEMKKQEKTRNKSI